MLKPKKSLGQNFLESASVLEKIIVASNINQNDLILEIGPGTGNLTEKLLSLSESVLAVEIDKRCVEILKKKFEKKKNFSLINEDILKFDFCRYLKENFTSHSSYKVVANIPYYITAPILRALLEAPKSPEKIILMTQKEVAQRIIEGPGALSLLALSVQYYAQAKKLFDVPKEAFFPVPKVDSAVLEIIPLPKNEINEKERSDFFRIIRIGFSAKRKTLSNNLSNGLHLNKTAVENALREIGLNEKARAQELAIKDWIDLSKRLPIN